MLNLHCLCLGHTVIAIYTNETKAKANLDYLIAYNPALANRLNIKVTRRINVPKPELLTDQAQRNIKIYIVGFDNASTFNVAVSNVHRETSCFYHVGLTGNTFRNPFSAPDFEYLYVLANSKLEALAKAATFFGVNINEISLRAIAT